MGEQDTASGMWQFTMPDEFKPYFQFNLQVSDGMNRWCSCGQLTENWWTYCPRCGRRL